MKQEELMLSLAKLMFPSELLDHFSLVHITETPTDVVFHLEERDVLQLVVNLGRPTVCTRQLTFVSVVFPC